MSNTDQAPPASPRAISVVAALVAWIGFLTAGVGFFDQANFGTDVGGRMIWVGGLICVIGLVGLGLIRLRGPLVAKKLVFLSVTLTALLLFPLFIIWRIMFSMEYIDNCDDGDAVACRTVATTRVKRGRTQEGIELYKKGCALNDARSCRELAGQAQKHPELVDTPAAEIYAKACDLGDAIGCNRAGRLLRDEDPARAITLFQKACDMEYLSACSDLADLQEHADEDTAYPPSD